MKKILLLFLSAFPFNPAFTQYNVIKIDIVGALSSDLQIIRPSVERSFGKYFSALLSYENGRYSYAGSQTNGGPMKLKMLTTGWGIMSELRYYPSSDFKKKKPAPLGVFLGIHYRYRSILEEYNGINNLNKTTYASFKTTATTYNFGVDAGCKLSAGYLILEGLFGLGMSGGNWQTPNERDKIESFFNNELTDISNALRLELSVGLVFPRVKKNVEQPENLPSAISYDTLKNDLATVVIYRPKSGFGFLIDYDLYVNDSFVTNVSNCSYHIFETKKTGRVTFSARTEDKASIEINLEKGKTYYLECGVTAGIAVGQPSFEIVEPATGQEKIEKIKNKLQKKQKNK